MLKKLVCLVAFVVAFGACNLPAKTVVADVLSAAQAACIIANAASDDATIMQVCMIESQLAPLVREVADATLARQQRMGCPLVPPSTDGK